MFCIILYSYVRNGLGYGLRGNFLLGLQSSPASQAQQLAGAPRARTGALPHPGGYELSDRVPLWETDWEEASRLGKATACMQAIIRRICTKKTVHAVLLSLCGTCMVYGVVRL